MTSDSHSWIFGKALFVSVLLHAGAASAQVGELLSDDTLVWSSQRFGTLLAKATNPEAMEYGRIYAETSAFLGKTDPSKCVRMIYPSMFGPLRASEWPKHFLDRQMAIQRRIVTTALANPNVEPSEEVAGPLFDKAMAVLSTEYGAEAGRVLTSTVKEVDAKTRCLMWSRLYAELVKLPVDEGGVVIRWLNAP